MHPLCCRFQIVRGDSVRCAGMKITRRADAGVSHR